MPVTTVFDLLCQRCDCLQSVCWPFRQFCALEQEEHDITALAYCTGYAD